MGLVILNPDIKAHNAEYMLIDWVASCSGDSDILHLQIVGHRKTSLVGGNDLGWRLTFALSYVQILCEPTGKD